MSDNQQPSKSESKDGNKGKGDSRAGCELNPWPNYVNHRIQLWEKYMKRYKEELAAKSPQPIKITLPDGTVKEGESWRTTPLQVDRRYVHITAIHLNVLLSPFPSDRTRN